MLNNQLNQTLQSMRSIISNLKQSEQNNIQLAQQLAGQEMNNANLLNNAGQLNLQGMAGVEANAANILNQFANAERNAVQQLEQLDQIVLGLQNQLS